MGGGGGEMQPHAFVTLALDGAESSASDYTHALLPRQKYSLCIGYGTGWILDPVYK
jgi:hypothetical protein